MSLALLEQDERLTDIARAAIWDAWKQRATSRIRLTKISDYAHGRGGIPELAPGASKELKDIASLSRLGMARTVLKTYLRGLTVTGFRSPTAADNDPVWGWWQAHRMDARQALAHRPALTYGVSYASLLPDDRTGDPARPAFWNPLNAIVSYEAPDDEFPESAVLMRPTREGRSMLFIDRETVTPVLLRKNGGAHQDGDIDGQRWENLEVTGDSWAHGAVYDGQPVCPVVRFVDDAEDDERYGLGVVEPVIELNRAMNQVNFDRLVVSRFGAYDQKVIIGWSTEKQRLTEMSAAHISTIDRHPDDVRIESWQASALAPYSELIREMREQVALEAAIPLWAAGNISNVSTDTAAMIEAAHQRELGIKRNSYGESWEQLLRLAVDMNGQTQPADDAEMIWQATQVQTFAGVVDGITKLANIPADAAGVPIEMMLDLIPGMSQQKIDAIADAILRNRSQAMMAALLGSLNDPGASQVPLGAPGAENAPIPGVED